MVYTVPEKKVKIQMAKGKWQMFWVPCAGPCPPLTARRTKTPAHLPFDLYRFPLDLLLPEKKLKIQTAEGNGQL
jgi:hypothetical protein